MKIGYARETIHKQDIYEQVNALTEYGCETIYEETGSGAKHDRPELFNLLKTLRADDTLVVTKLDRLTRSIKELIDIINDLNKRDIQFVSIAENIETSSLSGKSFLHVFSVLAEFEQNVIQERTSAGRKAARARGRKGGRKPKLTIEQIKVIKEKLDAPGNFKSVEDYAKDYGVSRSTVFRALDKLSRVSS